MITKAQDDNKACNYFLGFLWLRNPERAQMDWFSGSGLGSWVQQEDGCSWGGGVGTGWPRTTFLCSPCGLSVWASLGFQTAWWPRCGRTTKVRFPGNEVKAAWPFTTLVQKSSLHFTVHK